MLVHQIKDLVTRRSSHRPKRDTRGGTSRDAHTATQAENRIENWSCGIGQRPAIGDRGCRVDGLPASQKTRPVCLELHVIRALALDHGEVRRPDRWIATGMSTAGRENGTEMGAELRLHEEFGKGWMGYIVTLPCQHEFGVGRELDFARAGSVV